MPNENWNKILSDIVNSPSSTVTPQAQTQPNFELQDTTRGAQPFFTLDTIEKSDGGTRLVEAGRDGGKKR